MSTVRTTTGVNDGGRPEAEDLPQQHPQPAGQLEGRGADARELRALPRAEVAPHGVPHVRYVQPPPSSRRLISL